MVSCPRKGKMDSARETLNTFKTRTVPLLIYTIDKIGISTNNLIVIRTI